MRDIVGLMMHHRVPAKNVAFSPKTPVAPPGNPMALEIDQDRICEVPCQLSC